MKVIDIDTWSRAKSYKWFSSFSNPTYAVSARMDVTALVNYVKKRGLKFYERMLYLAVRALNSVPELRLRVLDGKVCEYDAPAASFTVAAEDGSFYVCCVEWNENSEAFCGQTRKRLEQTKKGAVYRELGETDPNVYYFSTLPWLDFTKMSDPIPDDPVSQSIPRICWGKYVEGEGRYELNLNITVSHALVDGKHLCDVFNKLRESLNDCEKIFNGGNANE